MFEQLLQFIVTGITLGAVYSIVALGFTVIFNVTGIINFAQGEFVMLGAMFSVWLLATFALPLPLAFLLAVLATAAVGLLLERLAIRPARHAPTVSLIIITIGASILIRGVAGQVWGKDALVLPAFSGEQSLRLMGAAVQPQSLWVLGTTLTVMLTLHLLLTYTMLGKALRACSINRRAASLVGVDAQTMSAVSFVLAAALGAAGGIVMAPMTMTSYGAGTMLGLRGFTAAALGGFGSQLGAVVGGMVLGLAEALGAGFINSAYKDAIALVVLFLVLFVRASGRRGEA